MKNAVGLIMALLIFGCSSTPEPRDHIGGVVTANAANSLSLGMGKSEVLEQLGNPLVSSADDGVEFLRYRVVQGSVYGFGYMGPDHANFFVKLQDGLVIQYGKIGDFDSTKNPTIDINLN